MINEINIVKHIIIQKSHLIKIDQNFNYYIDSVANSYNRILNILEKLSLQKSDRFNSLLHLHFDYMGIGIDLYNIGQITDYALRRNQLESLIIKIHFEESKSICHLLNETVDIMLHLKNTVPIIRCPYNEIEKAYRAIDRFSKHGHYLPNLSKNKDEHHIKDVLLYLKHVEKTVFIVYEHGVMSILRKIGCQS